MTITAIGIGAAPGDGTGDGLRTAFNKVNNNFSDVNNAASKLVGTGAGELMEVGTFGLGLNISRDDTINLDAHFSSDTIYGLFSANTPTALPVTELSAVTTVYSFKAIASGDSAGRMFLRELFLGSWGSWYESYTSKNLEPQETAGINVPRLMINNTAGSHAAGTTGIAGSDLGYPVWNTSSIILDRGPSFGQWTALDGVKGTGQVGLYVRKA